MYTLRMRQKVAAAGSPLIDEDCNCCDGIAFHSRVGLRAWAIFTRTDGAHGVEICLSAADIPNTTFARTSMLLMFESCIERPGCDAMTTQYAYGEAWSALGDHRSAERAFAEAVRLAPAQVAPRPGRRAQGGRAGSLGLSARAGDYTRAR